MSNARYKFPQNTPGVDMLSLSGGLIYNSLTCVVFVFMSPRCCQCKCDK